MKEVMKDLKEKQFKNVYLFFGEESYLVKLYEHKMRDQVVAKEMDMMNTDIFESKDTTSEAVLAAAETLPFMSDNRLVVYRGSGLFATGKKDETDKMAAKLDELPGSTVLVFVEEKVDKRNKLYKKVASMGRAVEFKIPSEKDLADWVVRSAKKAGKKISANTAGFLLHTVTYNMETIEHELQKAIDFIGEREEILKEDVASVCTKSLESKIFELVGAIGNRQPHIALDIYNNLIMLKESPLMVLSMVARQFRLILQAKLMQEKGIPSVEAAKVLGQPGFVIGACMRQAKHFSKEQVLEAISDCLRTDTSIKSGQMQDKLAVEVLIMAYSGKV